MYFFYYMPVGINAVLRKFPFMTTFYAVVCGVVFLLNRYFHDAVPLYFYNFIFTPAQGNVFTAIAAAFLHMGYLHLIGNLLYLILFGRYVEDRMGPFLFALLFLSSAAVGNYTQGLFNVHVLHDADTGIIGASGAVSGLLGAFSVRLFMSKLQIAYWVFLPLQAFARGGKVEMPAIVAVALWFLLQSAQGLVQAGGFSAKVAHLTHISGFVWGVGIATLFGQLELGRVEALWDRALRYMRRGEPYAAQGAFIRYLTRRPDDGQAYAALARAMILTGNSQGARKNYQKACEVLLEQGKRGESEDVYRQAVRGFPDFHLNPHQHLDLAFGLERNLKPDTAVRAYENFERRYPLHREAPFALLRAATIHWGTFSNGPGAEACYRKLIEKYPDDAWVDFAREQLRWLGPQRRSADSGGSDSKNTR